jgi:hypothetical protein
MMHLHKEMEEILSCSSRPDIQADSEGQTVDKMLALLPLKDIETLDNVQEKLPLKPVYKALVRCVLLSNYIH